MKTNWTRFFWVFLFEFKWKTFSVHYLCLAEYCIWMRECPLGSASLNMVVMKYRWGHTRVYELHTLRFAYVTHSCSPWRRLIRTKVGTVITSCEKISPTFRFLPYVSYLIPSFVRMEMNEWRRRRGSCWGVRNSSLSLPCSWCLCNLQTGLQSATEPLFIRLILKSTFCRPRKRLAKL